MTTSKIDSSSFALHLWRTLGMFVIFAATFIAYVDSEKQIDRAHESRERSFLLAQELRQSSDDLTRMARAYVVTGQINYKNYYQEILAIRDGKKPRPIDYSNVYWDLVLRDHERPRQYGAAVPLLALMHQAGFTTEEFAKLAEAKANSDALTHTESVSMDLVESANPVSATDRGRAIEMLFDERYHGAKADILRPISAFRQLADQRTLKAVEAAEGYATSVRMIFVLFGALLTYMLWNMRQNLNKILGGSVDEIHARIAHLGSGAISSPIPVAQGMENSVMGWLSQTQGNLSHINSQHAQAESKNQRLTQLYGALSQCSQAIVRCNNEADLFIQICRVVVTFGGMKMAWIGMLDKQNLLRPVSCFGSGTEYLDNLHFAVSYTDTVENGRRENLFSNSQPLWIQDFQLCESTAARHLLAAQHGFRSAAVIPLHKNGRVVGVFCMYADVFNAFDSEARSMLTEMASDIDYALKGFDRERERMMAEDALRESELHLRTIIETEPECIKVVDSDGHLLQINAAGLAMLELDSLEQAQQHNFSNFVRPEYRAAFDALHQRVMNGESGTLEFEITGLHGTQRWLETHAAPMPGADGKIKMRIGVARDITARKQAEQRVQYLAHYDALTGLPNRTQLEERGRLAIHLAQRRHASLALMFLDLDHFKDINDTLGHSIGDTLLIELAKRLRTALREEDIVSRLGGDEFIFLLYEVDANHAAAVAQKLLNAIAQPFRIEPYDLHMTGSIGIAVYPNDGEDLETLLRSADSAMYRVKQDNRNGYRFFTAEMQAHSARHLQLVNALRLAIERNELHIHYQPQVAMQGGQIIGAEALLRWKHPELGSISPAEFIPVAEDSGLILPIGEWVLRQAVQQIKHWMEDGLHPMVMAVNLSAVQFRHPNLPHLVSSILDEAGLPPEYLELELTEGVAMLDPQAAIAVMNQLHDRGVRMSIDDFGTGYSSLSHLKKFKVYKLKIDQSFVRDISTDPEDKAIVSAIINMAKSLGLQTIAEGVETEGQLAFLREQGCDEMQGYYFSKPLPADLFAEFARVKSAALQPSPKSDHSTGSHLRLQK